MSSRYSSTQSTRCVSRYRFWRIHSVKEKSPSLYNLQVLIILKYSLRRQLCSLWTMNLVRYFFRIVLSICLRLKGGQGGWHHMHAVSILHTVHVAECLCEVQEYLRRGRWVGLGGASQDNLKGICRKLFLLPKFF